MKASGITKMTGELTVVSTTTPFVQIRKCETCGEELKFDANGILICQKCRPS